MDRTFADLTKYVKRAPRIEISVMIIAILFAIHYFFHPEIITASLFIIVPSIITLCLDQLASVATDSKLNLRKNLFLLALTLIMFYFIYTILNLLLPELGIQNVAISLSFTSFFRFLVFYVYLSDSMAANYVLSNTLSMSFLPLYLYEVKYIAAVESIIYTLLSSWLAYVFVTKATKTFREKYNTEPRDLIKFFLYGIHGNKYYESGDKFFRSVYRNRRNTDIDSLTFIDSDGKSDFSMVFPYIHPGPFGSVGSSDLPERIEKYMGNTHGEVMVFHTATTNSDNCAGEEDIENLGKAIDLAIEKGKIQEQMSEMGSRVVDGVRIDVKRFGNTAMVAFNPESRSFDDILYEEGIRFRQSIFQKTGIRTFIIDGQNGFVRGAREIEDLSPFENTVIDLLEKDVPNEKIEVGYASGNRRDIRFLAAKGIQIAVFHHSDKKDCIMLTDSNNITREMEEMIRNIALKYCSSFVVYTTDNHVVNSGTLDMNPLNSRDEATVNFIEDLIRKAASAKKEYIVKYSTASVEVSTGNRNTYQELMDFVFISLKKAKIYAGVTVFLTFFIPIVISLTGIVLKIPFI
ncbi:MAG: DUF2070 family protein [Candidatus Thermoplasmatota archaeon]|nr:DUF2070 family protein [Candidatus Thermoplasmatota archaeon]MCL5987422.1 DUF2070 family protein [Candidatus Thermoplasmatota archaeon]